MAGIFQIRVVVGGKTHMVTLDPNEKVDELFRIVAKKCANVVKPEDLAIVFGDETLKYNEGKTLQDYRIVHLSTVTLLVRLTGGTRPLDAIEAEAKTSGSASGIRYLIHLSLGT